MSRCRETAGLLLPRKCDVAALEHCSRCKKPVCERHRRLEGETAFCVSCIRQDLKNPANRARYARYERDEFFYWYFDDDFEEDFTAADFAVFDAAGGLEVGAEAFDSDWSGS